MKKQQGFIGDYGGFYANGVGHIFRRIPYVLRTLQSMEDILSQFIGPFSCA